MDYAYSDLVERCKSWAQHAFKSGWISDGDCEALSSFDTRGPDSLFSGVSATQTRPLIVAFLGGTGVGKSSLLNRLAGAAIAKAGVERPTSKEVTLYHHRAISIAQLPEGLPIEKINIATHDDLSQRAIIWMDMPDFDSTDPDNKQLVLKWLPHIDILIYVVSPERYRDNKAWRILQAEGGKHAWLFVLNQWDRGQQEQYDDFIRQLHLAGFQQPLVLRTICNGNIDNDEFSQLQATIASLATGHTVEQLQQRGLQIKKEHLQRMLRQCLDKFGQNSSYQALLSEWQKRWAGTSDLIQQAMDWPMQQMADVYAMREGRLLEQTGAIQNLAKRDEFSLWDEWSQNRFEDTLDEVILLADQLRLPVSSLKQGINPVRVTAEKTVRKHTELAVRTALAKPGNNVQRLLLHVTRIAEVLLPLAAMGWAGYQLLQGYYQSSLTHSAYLGVDFAVHSILLISLSWLLPFFMRKKIQPSLQKTALTGLKKGLSGALSRINGDVTAALQQIDQQRLDYVAEAEKLLEECNIQVPGREVYNKDLSRMLLPK